MNISIAQLHAFTVDALLKAGVCEADARVTADTLVTTDSWGVFTHGTKALGNYIRRVRGGGLRRTSNPTVVRDGPAWALVDAGSCLAMASSVFAMNLAIRKARESGIALVGVRNNCHYGAAGYYASLAIPHDMLGFSMANDIPTVNGPGAMGAVLGSNPFAFAAPASRHPPILLDMATSTVAGGKVFAAAALGRPIPPGWLVDAQGQPSVDATLFSHAASLTPLGGYKGFGIALMIELLAATLTGAAMTREVLSWSFADAALPTGHGAAFLAIDIGRFVPVEEFKRRVDALIDEVHHHPRAAGVDAIRVPGEIEWEQRARALERGIDLPEDVVASLRKLGDEIGLDIAAYAQSC